MLKPSLKNNKAIYVGLIFILIATVIASYFYFKQANKEITKKPTKKPTIAKPTKPPKVKKYKTKVIVKASFSKEKSDREGYIYPKKPEDYGILTQMEGGGPTSIAVDKLENIYVLDSIGSNIKKYSKNGKFIKAIPSPFEIPTDIAVDDESNLYLLDEGGAEDNFEVIKINQNGKPLIGYKLSDDLSPPGVISLSRIQIINSDLYGIFNVSEHSHPALFDPIKKLPKGYDGDISVKIGSSKKAYDSIVQLKNLTLGIIGSNNKGYKLKFIKKRLVFTDGNKFTFVNYENYKSSEMGSRDILEVDEKENIYFYDVISRNNIDLFLIQKYSNGQLVAEATLPFDWSGYYQWKKLIAVADSGTIYYLYTYANIKSKDYLGGVKIIKCTLE